MEKLKQLKLRSAVVLLEKEMKTVYGGSGCYGSGGGYYNGSGSDVAYCYIGSCICIGVNSAGILMPTRFPVGVPEDRGPGAVEEEAWATCIAERFPRGGSCAMIHRAPCRVG